VIELMWEDENIFSGPFVLYLNMHKLWKIDRENTRLQPPWALPDFCTEYGAMLITFCRLFWKKILSIRGLIFCMTILIIEQVKFNMVGRYRLPVTRYQLPANTGCRLPVTGFCITWEPEPG